eukprot:g12279.t1
MMPTAHSNIQRAGRGAKEWVGAVAVVSALAGGWVEAGGAPAEVAALPVRRAGNRWIEGYKPACSSHRGSARRAKHVRLATRNLRKEATTKHQSAPLRSLWRHLGSGFKQ